MINAAAHIHSTEDARRLAKRRLPWMIFDYIDGAAGNEAGAARNRAAMDAVTLQPRILRDVSARDLTTTLFDQTTSVPFGIAPMGMCNLSAPGADLMLARLAAKHKIPHGVSTVASTPLEEIIDVAEGHAWFQLYFSGDGTGTKHLWSPLTYPRLAAARANCGTVLRCPSKSAPSNSSTLPYTRIGR